MMTATQLRRVGSDIDGLLREVGRIGALPLERAETLPPGAYTSAEFFQLEVDRVFKPGWMCVAHVSQLPARGDAGRVRRRTAAISARERGRMQRLRSVPDLSAAHARHVPRPGGVVQAMRVRYAYTEKFTDLGFIALRGYARIRDRSQPRKRILALPTPNVPNAYLGVWKRKLLRTPEFEDTASSVYWMQTSLWHGDIRIPVYRPPCTGKHSLAQCTREELLDLSSQQGFAGTTTVEGDTCRWLRRIDFQPPSGFNDVGRIEFSSADLMLEYGVEQEYFEIWERLPDSVGQEHAAVEFNDGDDPRAARPSSVLLATGNYFIYARPRRMVLPQADSLSSLTGDDHSLRAALDFEISFGTRSGPPATWVIQRSTFPWREGERLGMV